MEEGEPAKTPRPKRSSDIGPAGEALASRLKALREERRLTTEQLATLVTEIGQPMRGTAITKIEKKQRRVDADDLVALALALNVSPLALLFSEDADSGRYNKLTNSVVTTGERAWLWGTGEQALAPSPGDDPSPEQQEEYERAVRPARLRWVRQHPAGRAADLVRKDVHRAVTEAPFVGSSFEGDPFDIAFSAARDSVARLSSELDRLERDRAGVVRGVAESMARDTGESDG